MNRVIRRKQQGFTLIELMLSMSFLSMLLIVIMLTIMQITRIYDKGVSMREVNQVGRSVAADLTRTIGSASPFDLASTASFRQTTGSGGQPNSGRLCTGQSSYVWNIGDATVNGSDVRFVKVHDPTGEYCSSGANVSANPNKVDLLEGGERDLVMHNFTISQLGGASVSGQALYSVRFIIGVKDTTLLESNNAACKPPAESQGGSDFCAVNRFDLVIRAGNKELLSE